MKYKYKKIFLLTFTLLYIVLTIIELIKYLKLDSELFGLIYNIINATNYRNIYLFWKN